MRLQCRDTQSLWNSRSCKVYTRVIPKLNKLLLFKIDISLQRMKKKITYTL